MTRRVGSVYLWIALLLAVPVGGVRDLAGTDALIAAYVIFAALTATAVWTIGAANSRSGRARQHPAFLSGVLLIAGPLVLVLGASVTGAPTAARPDDYLLNTTALLLGSLIMVAGFVVLFARIWETGERLPPILGLTSLLIGSALWLANLIFRYAVVASGAADQQAGVEDQAWFAHKYLLGLQDQPSWMEFLLVWTDMLQLAFVLLAYLSGAACGAALRKAGWVGKAGGYVFVALNLVAALFMTVGIVLAGAGSIFAAELVLILTIPFMVFILPYFMGVVLVRRGSREGAAIEQEETVAAGTTLAG
jgi:hypothetical protein